MNESQRKESESYLQVPVFFDDKKNRFVFYRNWVVGSVIDGALVISKNSESDGCTVPKLIRRLFKIEPKLHRRTPACFVHDELLRLGFTSTTARNEMDKIHERYGVGWVERSILFAGVMIGDAYYTIKGDRRNNKRKSFGGAV